MGSDAFFKSSRNYIYKPSHMILSEKASNQVSREEVLEQLMSQLRELKERKVEF